MGMGWDGIVEFCYSSDGVIIWKGLGWLLGFVFFFWFGKNRVRESD